MPWHLENRDGKVCVVKDADGSVAGCHDSRTDAIKQQRALYANESRMASMYDELDAQTEDYGWVEPEPVVPGSTLSPFAAELVGMILKDEREKSLTASLAQSMDAIAERMASEKAERTALVAALSQIGQPVINVETPEVTVNVPPAEVRVDVPAPQVTVRPEINLPPSSKTVTFERDAITGQIAKAEVTESGE